MPKGECCQEVLIDALSSGGRESVEHCSASTIVKQTVERGLEYMFDNYNLDVIIVLPETAKSTEMIAPGGYPAVSIGRSVFSIQVDLGVIFTRVQSLLVIAKRQETRSV